MPPDLHVFIEVYDSSNHARVAGAKLSTKSVHLPFRFQLFKENLLIPLAAWKKMGEFDQQINVRVCKTSNILECSSDGVLYSGEAVSKVVKIGTTDTGVRSVRIFPFIKLKPHGNSMTQRS